MLGSTTACSRVTVDLQGDLVLAHDSARAAARSHGALDQHRDHLAPVLDARRASSARSRPRRPPRGPASATARFPRLRTYQGPRDVRHVGGPVGHRADNQPHVVAGAALVDRNRRGHLGHREVPVRAGHLEEAASRPSASAGNSTPVMTSAGWSDVVRCVTNRSAAATARSPSRAEHARAWRAWATATHGELGGGLRVGQRARRSCRDGGRERCRCGRTASISIGQLSRTDVGVLEVDVAHERREHQRPVVAARSCARPPRRRRPAATARRSAQHHHRDEALAARPSRGRRRRLRRAARTASAHDARAQVFERQRCTCPTRRRARRGDPAPPPAPPGCS